MKQVSVYLQVCWQMSKSYLTEPALVLFWIRPLEGFGYLCFPEYKTLSDREITFPIKEKGSCGPWIILVRHHLQLMQHSEGTSHIRESWQKQRTDTNSYFAVRKEMHRDDVIFMMSGDATKQSINLHNSVMQVLRICLFPESGMHSYYWYF